MYFDYKNTRIFYETFGSPSKPSVLLLHGFTENGLMWDPVIDAFYDDFLFVVPDLLGHGKSGLTGRFLTMEEQAEAAGLLLEFLGIKQVSLIGHSMGGYTALAFAEMFLDMLKGLMLYHSKPQADDPEKAAGRDQAIRSVQEDKFGFLSHAIRGFFAPYNREKFDTEIRDLVEMAAMMPVEGITGALRGMKIRKDRSDIFFRHDHIVKGWIVGRDDPLIDFNRLASMAAQHPHIHFYPIQGGHMSYVENPEEMINALEDFLKKTYA
jgi:pimeloyl-ACP methyl ester carboxylesterase